MNDNIFHDQEFTDNTLEENLKLVNEIIDNGTVILNTSFLEDMVDECIAFMRYNSALIILDELIKFNPYDSHLFSQIGICYSKTCKYEEADYFFEKAMALNPLDIDVLIEKLRNLGLIYDNEALQKEIEYYIAQGYDAYKIYYNAAEIYYELTIYEIAEMYFNKCYQINPKRINLLLRMGDLYYMQGMYQKSLRYYSEYKKLKPNHIYIDFDIARILVKTNQHEKAKKIFSTIIKSDKGFLGAYYHLALIYYKRGDYQKASKLFKRVIKGDKYNFPSYYYVAKIYNKQKKFDEAIKYLNMAVLIEPTSIKSHLLFCEIYIFLKQDENALKSLAKSLVYDILKSSFFNFRNERQIDEVNIMTVSRLSAKLIDMFPIDLAYDYIENLIVLGKGSVAVEFCFKNVEKVKKDSKLIYYMGLAYLADYKLNKALFLLKRAFKRDISTYEDFKNIFPLVSRSKVFKEILKSII